MAFTTSGQETERAYSYSPGAHTGRRRYERRSMHECPLRRTSQLSTVSQPKLTSDRDGQTD